MTTSHVHKFVTINCEITGYCKSFQLRLPSKGDWTLNLNSILKRIPKKLNLPSNIYESQLILSINEITINKEDPNHFGQLISCVQPPATIRITQLSVNYISHFSCHGLQNNDMLFAVFVLIWFSRNHQHFIQCSITI